MVFACPYSKTNNRRDSQRLVYRFLEESVSKILLLNILVIRPFLLHLCGSIGRPKSQYTFLFAGSKGRYDVDTLRPLVGAFFLQFTGNQTGILDYRHSVRFFADGQAGRVLLQRLCENSLKRHWVWSVRRISATRNEGDRG